MALPLSGNKSFRRLLLPAACSMVAECPNCGASLEGAGASGSD